jgi:RimJ/RimL family protein N-acetyltransferase
MVDIKIRSAEEHDSKDIFEWRNDRVTREMSHSSELIPWRNHSKWFSSSLDLKSRTLLICEDDLGEKIAMIRFDTSETNSVISINLNPSQRGKGLAQSCLVGSISFFSKENIEIKNFTAEIKEGNIASQKIFLGVGFIKYQVKYDIGFYKKILE